MAFDLYFPPEYLKAALILSLLSVWVLVGLYSYLNRYTKRRYFSIWTTAWLFYALWLTLGIAYVETTPPPLVSMFQQWCLGASAVFLLWGGADFLKHREPQRLYGLYFGFLMMWGYVGSYHMGGGFASNAPVFFLLGAASLWKAWCYLRLRKKVFYIGASLLTVGFTTWGLFLFLFPFLLSNMFLRLTAFFLSGVLQLFVAVSMIVLVLEEARQNSEELQKKYKEQLGRNAELDSTVMKQKSKLESVENRFRRLAMAAPVAILQVDREGKIIFANERWVELTGEGEEGQRADRWLFRIVEKERVKLEECWLKVLQFGDPFEEEFEILDREEKRRSLLGHAISIEDRQGGVGGCLITLADVTELKQAMSERHQLEAQLRQSQKMETLGTLAGGIAHSFNNLLQPIVGFAYLAQEAVGENQEVQEDLDYIIRAANRSKELVTQMLTFSRQTENEKMPLQIQYLVSEALKMIRASIPSSVEIRHEIDKDCSPVLADATQIHQVVMNLVTNAWHAVKDGGGRIEVLLDSITAADQKKMPTSLAPGSYVVLTVRDSGTGMSDDVRARIFEPFFTTKKRGQGTGLGLSVVHGIVSGHEGEVFVETQPGVGTEFCIYLPVSNLNVISHADGQRKVPRGSEHVLVVDDEKDITHLLGKILRNLGYRVATFNSSRQALAHFRKSPGNYDLLITDQTMPEMTGAAFAKEVLSIRENLPIIMVTGYSEDFSEKDSREAGIAQYLIKPIRVSDIGNIVRKVLDNGRTSKEVW